MTTPKPHHRGKLGTLVLDDKSPVLTRDTTLLMNLEGTNAQIERFMNGHSITVLGSVTVTVRRG